jgi:hypothetical protein
MPNWPKEMRTTINLEEANGKTQLQLIWQPIDPTKEEATILVGGVISSYFVKSHISKPLGAVIL